MNLDINSLVNSLMPTRAMPNAAQYISTTPSQFGTDSQNSLLVRAYNELKPYYSKLLTDASGDLNLAMQNLQQDYEQGTRYAKEDLQATMEQFGIQFPKEQQSLQDTLNKRGIALTQGQGNATPYAGGGQAGYEVGQLTEDQQLRQEAAQRTSQRQMTQLGQTYQRSGEADTRQAQQTGEQLQGQLETQATSRAGLYSGLQSQSNAANLQSQINQAQLAPGTKIG